MKPSLGQTAVATLGALWLSAPGLAQNALGDGRALDANTRVGSGRANVARPDFNQELALRNAIVTGNVGGGKHFRGSVGYTAENDFRGLTAEDSLYPFLRDSAYSGLATQNLRGLSGLQMQLESTVAGQAGGIGGDLIVRRAGGGAVGGEFTGANADASTPTIDPYGNIRGSLRSTGEFLANQARAPRVLGTQTDRSGTTYLTATPLQGIKPLAESNSLFNRTGEPPGVGPLTPPGIDVSAPAPSRGPTRWDSRPEPTEPSSAVARPESAPMQTRVPFDALVDDLAIRSQRIDLAYGADASRTPTGASAEQPSGPGGDRTADATAARQPGLVDRPAPGTPEFGAPAPPRAEQIPMPVGATTPDDQEVEKLKGDFISRMERLRERLSSGDALISGPAASDPKAEDAGKPAGDSRIPTTLGLLDPLKPPPSAIDDALLNEAQLLLAHGPARVERLTEAEGVSDLYSLHMLKGQQHLDEARWFDAEERFSAALRIKPGDAMAAAGRINAQIGAGMLLSAAVNLRNLLRAYPELIAARFDQKLFPRDERLQRIRAHLRQRSVRDTPVARDAGLILAYVGWQTGNAEDVAEGFSVVDRVDQSQGAAAEDLMRVLRTVWTGAGSKTPATGPTPR